jgi:hypothetical protein
MPDIDKRVARGMKLLDKKGPKNWRAQVDLNRLNMSHADRCVLGQVYGGFWNGLSRLGLRSEAAEQKVARHGFAAWDEPFYSLDLDAAWKRALTRDVVRQYASPAFTVRDLIKELADEDMETVIPDIALQHLRVALS